MASAPTSNGAELATEETNTTGVMTPILTASPERGRGLIFRNPVTIYADLKDSTDSDLPLQTNLALRYSAPGMDEPQTVSDVRDDIQPYNQLTISEQQNEDYRSRMRIPLRGRRLDVRHIDEFQVAINCSEQIDWTNSALYIDPDSVKEVGESALR